MDADTLRALLPLIIISATPVAVMLVLAFYRSHALTVFLVLAGLALSFASLFPASGLLPRMAAGLLVLDHYSFFFMGLMFAATFAVALLSYGYLGRKDIFPDEYYILLLIAAAGSAVIVSSSHFASFFLGLELLSVPLYALISYPRANPRNVEAGIKYLILAGTSSAFLLFGMALVYAELGTMEFPRISTAALFPGTDRNFVLAGVAMIITGIGFKLALVPFHMWTPDVYEGAPAPVAAFVATVSKGAMFALLLRYFTIFDIRRYGSLMLLFTVISIASMFAGNLLALFQNNVKRLLAYSSIAHLGYLLVAFLASGVLAAAAVAFYLAAYFVSTLGAFGVISVLSGKERDADMIDDYMGLAWRSPWLAGIFAAMLLSLAGIPLTAGFIGKFFIAAAGVDSSLWALVIILVINSAIGLFYYLRVIAALYSRRPGALAASPKLPVLGGITLGALSVALLWLGVYPATMLEIIRNTISRFF
ncbi:MAG: NADH-quinone oxidoreductase subunit N [Nitrospiraceae bacterium]|nr:NADH-quinone oxidoreductase subunit N [Nitrospiraceae bacterium]